MSLNARSASRQSGFTLVELMMVVVILGILSVVAIPKYISYVQRSKTSEAVGFLGEIKARQEASASTATCPLAASPTTIRRERPAMFRWLGPPRRRTRPAPTSDSSARCPLEVARSFATRARQACLAPLPRGLKRSATRAPTSGSYRAPKPTSTRTASSWCSRATATRRASTSTRPRAGNSKVCRLHGETGPHASAHAALSFRVFVALQSGLVWSDNSRQSRSSLLT
jgi:prepilin-type N-terminal cleavage/methylation domain-containing protein